MKPPLKYFLASDTINNQDMDALADWIKTHPRLTMGPLTEEYEQRWNQWIERKYSVFCNSGSSANLLMYYALLLSGRLKNKKVIVPSAAWVTSIAPAIQFGFEPIMCEADRETFGLNLNHLEELLKEHKPATVFMVHVLGVPNNMNRIMALKDKYGFFLLEDACAAMGSSFQGRKVGTFGEMASISTYFGHQFSTIEGGMVSTDDERFHTLLYMLRSHGWIKGLDDHNRAEILSEHGVEDIGTDFIFVLPGFNVRPTDLQAYVGISQLDKMDGLIRSRFANHELYRKLLTPHFFTQTYDSSAVVCSIHFCAVARDSEQRQEIVTALGNHGIETRLFTAGNQGRHPYWSERFVPFSSPIANKLYTDGFFLPNNPSLSKEDVEYIASVAINAIKEIVR